MVVGGEEWCSKPILDPYGVGMWRTMRQGWSFILGHILYEFGDATMVKFWKDRWRGESSLVVFYPMFFQIFGNKGASVVDLMQFSNGVLH